MTEEVDKVEGTLGGESTKKRGRKPKTKVREVETITKTVDNEPEQVEEMPLKKGDLYLVEVNGKPDYKTKYQIHVAKQRRDVKMVIPKGSPLVVSVPQENCVDCG